jgi:tripartite-type tricarboxylate transporter receptor subunit TctC
MKKKMLTSKSPLRISFVCGLALASLAAAGPAQSADFFKGKTINLVIGASPGEVYSITSRLFGQYLSKYIPGEPTIVYQNMPGAAGIRSENYVFNEAPKDGTTIALSLDNILLNPIMAPDQTRYRTDKFNWIGRGDRPTRILFVLSSSSIKTVDDAKKRDVITGMTAPGTSSQLYPSIANAMLGTRFKEVAGYDGVSGMNLALDRGEIEAVGANSWTNLKMTEAEWVRTNRIRPLFQSTLQRDPTLADVPTLLELCTTDEQRAVVRLLALSEIGFYLYAPPGVPADRVATLRAAFQKVLADPQYRSDAAKLHLGSNTATGDQLEAMAADVASTPPAISQAFLRAVTVKK